MKTHVMSFLNARVRTFVPLAATLTIVLLAGLAPDLAHAQTCHNVLQGHVDWAVSMPDGPGDYYVEFAMVSNQLGLNATFAEGTLTSNPWRFAYGLLESLTWKEPGANIPPGRINGRGGGPADPNCSRAPVSGDALAHR